MESLMSAFRTAMLGLVAVAAMSTPALTQQTPTQQSPYPPPASYDGVTLYYPQTGRIVADHLSAPDMQTAMQHAQPVKGPVMIVLSGGQAYLVQDMAQPMHDGSPMVKYFETRMSGNR
jgi:hypothetical protein